MSFSDFASYLHHIKGLLIGISLIFGVTNSFNFTIIYCKIKLSRLEFLSYYVKQQQGNTHKRSRNDKLI